MFLHNVPTSLRHSTRVVRNSVGCTNLTYTCLHKHTMHALYTYKVQSRSTQSPAHYGVVFCWFFFVFFSDLSCEHQQQLDFQERLKMFGFQQKFTGKQKLTAVSTPGMDDK